MSESFTETSKISYGKNIMNSFSGVIIGFVIFLLSFVVLWKNEGNNVAQIHKAQYIDKTAIEISADKISRENDNKLVHLSGNATTDTTLADGIITVPKAFVLKRTVEMYQWKEQVHTETKDELGGSTTETKTYTYEKVWSDNEIDSQEFKRRSYVNPKFPVKSAVYYAETGKLGEFKLTQRQTKSMSEYSEYTDLPQKPGYKIYENTYYKGYDPLDPKIGDLRISYKVVPSGIDISIIGQQKVNNTLTNMVLKDSSVYLQQSGLRTKDEMINTFLNNNKFFTNLMRIIGLLMMYAGLNMIINPLVVIFKVVPFVKNIVGFITGGVIFVISLILSLLTIFLAWFAYRPFLLIGLLVITAGIIFAVKKYYKPTAE